MAMWPLSFKEMEAHIIIDFLPLLHEGNSYSTLFVVSLSRNTLTSSTTKSTLNPNSFVQIQLLPWPIVQSWQSQYYNIRLRLILWLQLSLVPNMILVDICLVKNLAHWIHWDRCSNTADRGSSRGTTLCVYQLSKSLAFLAPTRVWTATSRSIVIIGGCYIMVVGRWIRLSNPAHSRPTCANTRGIYETQLFSSLV